MNNGGGDMHQVNLKYLNDICQLMVSAFVQAELAVS